MDAEKRYENYLYAVLAVCAILVGCIVLGMIIGIAEAVSGNR